MTDIKQAAKDRGRSLPWIAANVFGVSRQRLYQKIDTDNFTPQERRDFADALGMKLAELFPAFAARQAAGQSPREPGFPDEDQTEPSLALELEVGA